MTGYLIGGICGLLVWLFIVVRQHMTMGREFVHWPTNFIMLVIIMTGYGMFGYAIDSLYDYLHK